MRGRSTGGGSAELAGEIVSVAGPLRQLDPAIRRRVVAVEAAAVAAPAVIVVFDAGDASALDPRKRRRTSGAGPRSGVFRGADRAHHAIRVLDQRIGAAAHAGGRGSPSLPLPHPGAAAG